MLLSEKLRENAKAAIDELANNLNKESERTASLQREMDQLRNQLVGQHTEQGNATPQARERMASLETEVAELRQTVQKLSNIARQREEDDEEDEPVKRRGIWRSIAWLCVIALGGWLVATYLGFLK